MTVYNFTNVVVWDAAGGGVKVARRQRVDVLDPATGLAAPSLTQNGQPVSWLTSDDSGRVTFTTTIPVARLSPPRGLWQDIPSNDLWTNITVGSVPFAASGEVSTTKAVRADDARLVRKAVNTGTGLTGGGLLDVDRTLAVDFAADGVSSATQAVKANDSRMSDARPYKGWPQPANATNLDTLTTVGLYPIAGAASAASMTPPLPVAVSGMLEVLSLGLARIQRWSTSSTPRQVWQRAYDGAWTTWRRIDRDTQTAIVSISRSQGTTYTVPSVTAYSFRQLLRTTTTPERFRVHLRNYEERTGTAYTATLNVNGVWIGEALLDTNGEMTGQFKTAPTLIASAFTMPIDGSIYLTPWVDWQTFKLSPGVDYIVSFGYTGPGGESITKSRGFGWGNGVASDAGATTTVNTISSTTLVPLSMRYEVDTQAPRVAMIGDSHTAANNARYPVAESPINLWAMANGAVPVNLGLGGSTLNEWRSVNQQKWLTYTTVKADAAIIWLGQNDVFNDLRTLAQMQADFMVVANSARTTFGPNLYAMTLLPRNGTVPAGTDTIRQQFNSWLKTLPCRLVGVIDAAAAVTDPATGLIRAEYVDPTDLTHLTTAGCNEVAQAMSPLIGRK